MNGSYLTRRSRDLRIREVFNCDEPVRKIRAVRRILPDLSKELSNISLLNKIAPNFLGATLYSSYQISSYSKLRLLCIIRNYYLVRSRARCIAEIFDSDEPV